MRAKPLLFLLLLPVFVKAEPKLSAYEELCLYDRLCSRLRNSDGTKVEPKPAVKKLIETMADPVHDFAKLYGVDPRAVAGAILAENSMNVQMDDEIQSWIVKNNIWGSKAFLNAGMTIGPGQINIKPAISADQHIASLGLRPARSADEITKLLLTPAGAAEYSAAILRQAQDAYKAEGIDISKRPDILVTLYNFGQEKMSYTDRAKETAKLKLEPRANFFGVFVAENIGAVEDAIGWSPEKGRYKKEQTELYEAGSLNMVTDDFTLQTAPPSCSTEGAGDQGKWRARQSWEPFQTFTPRNTKFLEIVGLGIDCQMREWLQMKTSNGELGWMPKSSLASVSQPLKKWQLAVSACGAPEKEDCLQKALGLYGQKNLDGRDNKGKYFLTVKKNDPNDPVEPVIRPLALAAYGGDDQCSGMKYPDLKKQYQRYLNPQEENKKALSRADLYDMKTQLAKKTEELKAVLGLQDEYQEVSLSDAMQMGYNPYVAQQNNGKWGAMANLLQNNSPMSGQSNSNPYGGQGFGMGAYTGNGQPLPQTVKMKKPSRNKYVQKLEYLDQRLDYCVGPEKIDCEIAEGEEDFKKFLATDLSKVRKLSEFKTLLNFRFDINRLQRTDKAAQQERESDLERALKELRVKREAQARAVREACSLAQDALPGLYQRISDAVAEIEKIENSGEFEYVFPAFQRACEQAWLLEEFKKNGNKLPDGSTAFNCSYKEDAGLENFTLDFLSKMELNSDDYSEMLKGQFETVDWIKKNAKSNPGQNSGWGNQNQADEYRKTLAACNYNALATAKAVEELSKSTCVESILVKDMSLGKNIGGGAKARVVLDTSLKSGQIAFTMKNDCRTDLIGRPKQKGPFNGGNKE
jgi:hypothetical protein